MASDLDQTPIIEPICKVVIIKDLVLELHPFLVWEQLVGVGFLLKTADGGEGAVSLYVAVMAVSISLASKTEDQELQSPRLRTQLNFALLWIMVNLASPLPRSMMNCTTNQILSLNTRMLSSSSSNHTAKIMFTRASNMVFGPALQMGIENWILHIVKPRRSKISVQFFSSFQ